MVSGWQWTPVLSVLSSNPVHSRVQISLSTHWNQHVYIKNKNHWECEEYQAPFPHGSESIAVHPLWLLHGSTYQTTAVFTGTVMGIQNLTKLNNAVILLHNINISSSKSNSASCSEECSLHLTRVTRLCSPAWQLKAMASPCLGTNCSNAYSFCHKISTVIPARPSPPSTHLLLCWW
jgi:hypothetical protein